MKLVYVGFKAAVWVEKFIEILPEDVILVLLNIGGRFINVCY